MVCDRKSGHMEQNQAMTALDYNDGVWYIEYRTHYACPPRAGECYTHDGDGNRGVWFTPCTRAGFDSCRVLLFLFCV